MKIFLSSTLIDLIAERQAVIDALNREKQSVLAMEYFVASPSIPLETALRELRSSDLVVLVIGFKAGSLLSESSNMTYTSAEYKEACELPRPILAFLKEKKWPRTTSTAWRNAERSKKRFEALKTFADDVGKKCTFVPFSSPSDLALAVIQSLHQWVSQGMPGSRKTFTSAKDFFLSKTPVAATPILDFSTSLFGRDKEIEALNTFLKAEHTSICIIAGRGGIGKSKLLHDWTLSATNAEFIFLKDEPHWHSDSEKEVPVSPAVLVVDDAHRSETIGSAIQLFRQLRRSRNLKLVLSTRPGGLPQITELLYRHHGFDPSEVVILPELQELTDEQAVALGTQVLGEHFSGNARTLALISGNTPLVIVAGGRLIASKQINPFELSNQENFRSTVFNRFLRELRLEGPAFPISPTRPVLDVIAALGPVDVTSEAFLEGAEKVLGRRRDEILATLEALSRTGIVTPIAVPVRLLPDVLSDFVMEERCIGNSRVSTRYADQIFKIFGRVFFSNLMRNLAELDWRLERSGYGLDLLSNIWTEIENTFKLEDAYRRRDLLEGLSSAAIYQPDRILHLVELALQKPIEVDENTKARHPVGQTYVIEAIPRLLEATAQHPEYLRRSIDILWEITQVERSSSRGAKAVLERLAAYHRSGYAFFNFAMLIQAIRLSQLPNALDSDFSPFNLIDKLLEREGEFSEFEGNTLTFGGFELNMPAVRPLRQNALDFLEHCLWYAADVVAIRAVRSLSFLLHAGLNRVGRASSAAEIEWQTKEGLQALAILCSRLERDNRASLILRSQIYHAIRSATGVNYQQAVREKANSVLSVVTLEGDEILLDAISRGESDFPLQEEFTADTWDKQIRQLIDHAHAVLMEVDDVELRASSLMCHLKTVLSCKLQPHGFFRLVASFQADTQFLMVLVDQIVAVEQCGTFADQLRSVLDVLHRGAPNEFHRRVSAILASKLTHNVRAAAGALRVYSSNATIDDISQIKAFLHYPDAWTRRLALDAIAFMGDNVHLHAQLLEAALSVEVGDDDVACSLAEAFGPYGVRLSWLNVSDVRILLGKFLDVREFEADQGAIPRFLSRLVMAFPDQVLELLLARIAKQREERKKGNWEYRGFARLYARVSFASLQGSDRLRLVNMCLAAYLDLAENDSDCAELFWDIAGLDEQSLKVVVDVANADKLAAQKIAALIGSARFPLASACPQFAANLLVSADETQKQQYVNAFVANAHHLPTGVYAGSPGEFTKKRESEIKAQADCLSDNPQLAPLAQALKRSLPH